MTHLKSAAVLAAAVAVFGTATPSFGAAGALTFKTDPPVTALSDAVTYRGANLQTFVGFNVGDVGGTNILLTNTGGNAVNNVSITLSATVTDAAETLTLYKPEVYLPSSCTWNKDSAGNPVPGKTVSFTCQRAHMANGATFPAFSVFYSAPTQGSTPLGSDFVDTNVRVVYGEGLNDQPSSPNNSFFDTPQLQVVKLGTTNPTRVKSGVPKDGVKLDTGNGAIPSPATYPFAASLAIPIAAAVTSAEIQLTAITDNDGVSSCLALANFIHCYLATVTVPPLVYTDANFMTLLLRIDGSEVGNKFNASNVQVFHDGVRIFPCQAGQPNNIVTACFGTITRYSNAAKNGELRSDVEIPVYTKSNGSWTSR
jgi:hypothetical protein